MNRSFIIVLLPSLWLGLMALASAQSAQSGLTLDQAVQQVQQDTGGKVLSAEPRRIGHRLEYRVKVLTPEGHVRVLPVSSEAGRHPAPVQSIKNPPGRHMGSKEKH